jgi:multidrug transporter EmrE-like cation transporter
MATYRLFLLQPRDGRSHLKFGKSLHGTLRHQHFKEALDKTDSDSLRRRASSQRERREPMMQSSNVLTGWFALLLAGLLEIAWALGLKYSDGLTRFWPSSAMVIAIALSFASLAVALKSIPFGTAYAMWTGIGAAGSMVVTQPSQSVNTSKGIRTNWRS